MSADYRLGFVQRDGNMHDSQRFGKDLANALYWLQAKRAQSDPHWIHYYVYDADDEERGYFEPGDEAA